MGWTKSSVGRGKFSSDRHFVGESLNAKASVSYNVHLSPDIFLSENGLFFEDIWQYKGYSPELQIFNSLKES